MDDLTMDSIWLNGPSFLKEGEESWPVMPEISQLKSNDVEVLAIKTTAEQQQQKKQQKKKH